jgi:hypothetical protein
VVGAHFILPLFNFFGSAAAVKPLFLCAGPHFLTSEEPRWPVLQFILQDRFCFGEGSSTWLPVFFLRYRLKSSSFLSSYRFYAVIF